MVADRLARFQAPKTRIEAREVRGRGLPKSFAGRLTRHLDFTFPLTGDEWAVLRAQRGTGGSALGLGSQTVILKGGRGQHRKYLPHAFTQQGVAWVLFPGPGVHAWERGQSSRSPVRCRPLQGPPPKEGWTGKGRYRGAPWPQV